MNDELKCEIVRDLLPSFADDLTSDVTREAVEKHLTDCPDCAAVFARMKEPEGETVPERGVDFLKKVRRKNILRVITACLSLAVVLCAAVFVRYYIIGTPVSAERVDYSFETDGKTVALRCEMKNGGGSLTRVETAEKDGECSLLFYGSPTSFLNLNRCITKNYTFSGEIARITADGLILWENGITVSEKAARLYNAQTPYVGDICTDRKIAEIAGLPREIGNYANELHTSSEPYSWTIIPTKVFSPNDLNYLHGCMEKQAYILLATIGNLSEVIFRYYTYDGPEEFSIDAATADRYFDRPIKEYAASASGIQCLLEELSLA